MLMSSAAIFNKQLSRALKHRCSLKRWPANSCKGYQLLLCKGEKWGKQTSWRARYCLGLVAMKEQSRAVAIVTKVEKVAIVAMKEEQSIAAARCNGQQTKSNKTSIAQVKPKQRENSLYSLDQYYCKGKISVGSPKLSWSHCASKILITPVCVLTKLDLCRCSDCVLKLVLFWFDLVKLS